MAAALDGRMMAFRNDVRYGSNICAFFRQQRQDQKVFGRRQRERDMAA
jgi:hypothetical protein